MNINSRLSRLLFVLKRNIVNYRNIQILFFFNKDKYQSPINVYSDSLYITIDFLSNKALYVFNLLYIKGTFNIKDAKWNPFVSSYSIAS